MLQRATHRAGLAGLAGLALASLIGFGTSLPEYALFDLRTAIIAALRPSQGVETGTAVIRMDKASEDALGVPQGPEWRQFHARLVEVLTRAGARVIAFDAEFAATSPWDEELGRAFLEAGNVVAGEISAGSTNAVLRRGFRDVGSLTFGTARGLPRWVEIREGEPVPLSVAIAELAGASGPPPGRVWIDFSFPIDAIPSFSYSEVLGASPDRLADEARTPLSVFQGRIVLIGKDLPWEGDSYVYPNTAGQAWPGVYGQAYAVETLLAGRRVRRVSPLLDLALILVVCVIAAAAQLIRPRIVRVAVVSTLALGVSVVTAALLAGPALWLGLTGPWVAIAVVVVTNWITRRMWLISQLRRALGFRPDLIEAFRSASRKSGGMVQRGATVVCSDVRSFTRFVRENPPDAVARVMSRYVSCMEDVVTRHGGYVNKYVGDEIVAIFGFPLNEVACERRAIECALEMLEQLRTLQAEWADAGLPSLEAIGIGIDTGTLTFAEVGGTAKVQFDIIGDSVNGASRLQGLTKETGRPLLVSAECFRGVEAASVAGRFETLGFLALRGQGERQVLAPRKDTTTV